MNMRQDPEKGRTFAGLSFYQALDRQDDTFLVSRQGASSTQPYCMAQVSLLKVCGNIAFKKQSLPVEMSQQP
jgi:hypothetical protein